MLVEDTHAQPMGKLSWAKLPRLGPLLGRRSKERTMQRALASYASEQDPASIVQVSFSDGSVAGPAAHPFRAQPEDKRSAPRRRVLLSAMIVSHDLNTIYRCQVRDVSDQGARLNIPGSFLVPAGFWLIALSSGLAYEAKLAWRRLPSLGVSLGEPIDLDEPTTRIGRGLRSLWVGAAQ